MNFDASTPKDYLIQLNRLLWINEGSDKKELVKKAQAKFESMFGLSSKLQQRKMMEWSIALNWENKLEWSLKQGVSPNGKLKIEPLIKSGKVRIFRSFETLSKYQDWTPLTLALFLDHFNQVHILLDHHAQTNKPIQKIDEIDGVLFFSPLFLSAKINPVSMDLDLKNQFDKMTSRLLELDPHLSFNDPTSPHFLMMSCITNKSLELFKKIIGKTSNLNEKDSDDETYFEYFMNTYGSREIKPNTILGEFFKVFMEHDAYVSDIMLNRLQNFSNPYPLHLYLTHQKEKLCQTIPPAQKDVILSSKNRL